MAVTIEQQLNQLQMDKETLIDNLVSKGVNATSEDTFTTLAPKVLDVPSGDISEYFNTNGFSNTTMYNTFLMQCTKKLPNVLETSNLTSFSYAFYHYEGIELPTIDTSNGTNFSNMYAECQNAEIFPFINTSNGTIFEKMYYACYNAKQFPLIDTSNGTNFELMYNSAPAIELPLINTSNGTKFRQMYDGYKGTELPAIDTSKAQSIYQFFAGCKNLINVPEYDFSSAIDVRSIASNGSTNIQNLGGFKNLGKAYTKTTSNYSSYTMSLHQCNLLTHDSLMNVINNLYDLNLTYDVENGGTLYTQTLQLGTTNMAKLTEEEIAIATNKGWNVV